MYALLFAWCTQGILNMCNTLIEMCISCMECRSTTLTIANVWWKGERTYGFDLFEENLSFVLHRFCTNHSLHTVYTMTQKGWFHICYTQLHCQLLRFPGLHTPLYPCLILFRNHKQSPLNLCIFVCGNHDQSFLNQCCLYLEFMIKLP